MLSTKDDSTIDTRRAESNALTVFAPPSEGFDWATKSSTVAATRLDAKVSDTQVLREAFRFTPQEARLAELLIGGKTPAQSAESLGISIHTVRSHLKKLMLKTRTNRQSALISVMIGALKGRFI